MARKKSNGPVPSEELLLLIERWERLQEEKKAIAADQKDVMAEAKSRGFDTKAMREIIRLRAMDPDVRRQFEAIVDTYRAALGMLDGTPLGKWAIQRLKKPEEEAPGPKPEDGGAPQTDAGDSAAEAPVEDATPPEPEMTVEDAHRLGAEAAKAGASVTSNPFPAFDERRAAWDESWCAALGSDGMEIPDALRPAAKPKKGDSKPAGEE